MTHISPCFPSPPASPPANADLKSMSGWWTPLLLYFPRPFSPSRESVTPADAENGFSNGPAARASPFPFAVAAADEAVATFVKSLRAFKDLTAELTGLEVEPPWEALSWESDLQRIIKSRFLLFIWDCESSAFLERITFDGVLDILHY